MNETFVLTRIGDSVRVDIRGPRNGGATAPVTVASSDLPTFVAERELDAEGGAGPRWVWDDTTRWYPSLLESGVRVRRCLDLRLSHDILRRSPHVDPGLLVGASSAEWEAMDPVELAGPALFAWHEHDEPLDSLAEFDRQQAALAASTKRDPLGLLLAAESSGALVAAEIAHAGLPLREALHERMLTTLIGPRPLPGARPELLEQLLPVIRGALGAPDLNPDSPKSLLRALRAAGLDVTDTRAWNLRQLDHPAVGPILEYKKLLRLANANGWRWLDTWVRDGRYRPNFLPGGTVTGRWAAHGGGALSFPAQIRSSVVADDGWKFVVADVAQLEPRVLAALSTDLAMAEAASESDLYEGMVKRGAVATRKEAKLGMLGAMYGSTSGEGGRMVTRMTRLYPRAFGFVEEAARAGERAEVVETFLGRASPAPTGRWTLALGDLPADDAGRDRDRRKWGRFTRNYVVQGSGAEWTLCWIATLRNLLWQLDGAGELTDRPHLVFFLHDEVLIHTPAALAEETILAVRRAAAEATRVMFGTFPIDFPLDVAIVDSWAEGDSRAFLLDAEDEDPDLEADLASPR
ncbi:bifunctional 3'-5' exonuclease/DNA polymerase [Amnibacterium flavum]|uniref:DNA-directed DNA polymerase n=1 Tax=Amnibacterium flavum TaxID=2173173 RepID=A0A2V1HUV5_9MICO|nr:bifunctional 3'-5' exonuclease/DNA polymerase [Amnibacterium flavum]PVZ96385.1 bifunctional 3'-5' exonuclease/DNA polymerase [Amnibacterium flavum]